MSVAGMTVYNIAVRLNSCIKPNKSKRILSLNRFSKIGISISINFLSRSFLLKVFRHN